MKPEIIEISYSVSVWNFPSYPNRWSFVGQRNTIAEARERKKELRKRFSRVRIIEHKKTSTVVL